MKTKISMLFIAVLFSATSLFAQSKTDTIKVWGNCESCKSKIEKAAKAAGASSADWSDETLLLVVNYDAAKTSSLNIEKQIASVGYDTQDIKGADDAYQKLDKCCQYDRHDYASSLSNAKSCCSDMSKCDKEGCCKADMSCCKKHDQGKECCSGGKCSGN